MTSLDILNNTLAQQQTLLQQQQSELAANTLLYSNPAGTGIQDRINQFIITNKCVGPFTDSNFPCSSYCWTPSAHNCNATSGFGTSNETKALRALIVQREGYDVIRKQIQDSITNTTNIINQTNAQIKLDPNYQAAQQATVIAAQSASTQKIVEYIVIGVIVIVIISAIFKSLK